MIAYTSLRAVIHATPRWLGDDYFLKAERTSKTCLFGSMSASDFVCYTVVAQNMYST